MCPRVPDERLDAREANLTAALTWVPHPYRVPATDDLAALVQDLRAARADNQRLREELAQLIAVAGRDETWCDQAVSNGRYVVPCRLARGHRGPCEPTAISAHGNLLTRTPSPAPRSPRSPVPDLDANQPRESLFTFLETVATSPDGSTFDVLMVEDPPGSLRPATAVETWLRDQVNSGRRYREVMEGLPDGTLPRV